MQRPPTPRSCCTPLHSRRTCCRTKSGNTGKHWRSRGCAQWNLPAMLQVRYPHISSSWNLLAPERRLTARYSSAPDSHDRTHMHSTYPDWLRAVHVWAPCGSCFAILCQSRNALPAKSVLFASNNVITNIYRSIELNVISSFTSVDRTALRRLIPLLSPGNAPAHTLST